jgi:hypothetical protein
MKKRATTAQTTFEVKLLVPKVASVFNFIIVYLIFSRFGCRRTAVRTALALVIDVAPVLTDAPVARVQTPAQSSRDERRLFEIILKSKIKRIK